MSIDLYPGELIGLVGHNGAGKSTLMRALSGAHPADSGEILINGKPASIRNPRDAKRYNIETIYQTLALADNIDAPGNMFLGREMTTRIGHARRLRHGIGDAQGHAPAEPELHQLQASRCNRCRAASARRSPSRGRSTSTPRS